MTDYDSDQDPSTTTDTSSDTTAGEPAATEQAPPADPIPQGIGDAPADAPGTNPMSNPDQPEPSVPTETDTATPTQAVQVPEGSLLSGTGLPLYRFLLDPEQSKPDGTVWNVAATDADGPLYTYSQDTQDGQARGVEPGVWELDTDRGLGMSENTSDPKEQPAPADVDLRAALADTAPEPAQSLVLDGGRVTFSDATLAPDTTPDVQDNSSAAVQETALAGVRTPGTGAAPIPGQDVPTTVPVSGTPDGGRFDPEPSVTTTREDMTLLDGSSGVLVTTTENGVSNASWLPNRPA